MRNIKRVAENLDVEIAGFLLSPLANSYVLSEPDKSLGCVLVNMGSGTTTVSIYKDSVLRHLAVIPLGGNSVTKDIISLQLMEKDAEQLKIIYGNVNTDNQEDGDKILKLKNSDGFDTSEIRKDKLNHVCFCRNEEIIENIINQVKISGYEKQLPAGYILTGGASNMNGLISLFKKKTDSEVKIGTFQKIVTYKNNPDICKDASLSTLLGLIYMGEVNCYKPEPVQPVIQETIVETVEPVIETANDLDKDKKGKFKKLSSLFNVIFKEDEEEQEFSERSEERRVGKEC